MATPLRAKKTASDPEIAWANVTPAIAKAWLESNTDNRNIRRRTVEKYARDMLAGAWAQTVEPIKFAADGRLLDGQHRLHAIVQSGVTVRLAVATDVPDEAQKRMDTGDKRTAADALAMGGYSNSPLVSAVARLALGVAYDRVGTFDATNDDILSWVEDHPEVLSSVRFASNLSERIDCPGSVIAYTHWALSKIDPVEADDFWSALAERIASYPGDPVIALARRFSDSRRDREVLSKRALLSMIYRAWNYRRAGKQLRQVKVASATGGLIPVPVPR